MSAVKTGVIILALITTKHKKIVNIILVRRMSSLLWADWAGLGGLAAEALSPLQKKIRLNLIGNLTYKYFNVQFLLKIWKVYVVQKFEKEVLVKSENDELYMPSTTFQDYVHIQVLLLWSTLIRRGYKENPMKINWHNKYFLKLIHIICTFTICYLFVLLTSYVVGRSYGSAWPCKRLQSSSRWWQCTASGKQTTSGTSWEIVHLSCWLRNV